MHIRHTALRLLRLSLLTFTVVAPTVGCVNEVEDGYDHFEPEDSKDNVLFQGVYDCTETEDDGYSQGNRFDITTVRVDGRPVEVNTANAYIAMQAAARDDGVTLRIVSGFRTMAQQEYFYGCFQDCNCNSCNVAARPGFSNHQSGHALDLNHRDAGVMSWLNNHGDEFGWRRTVSSEPWHWEWWGDEDDFQGPCGGGSSGGGGGTGQEAPSDCSAVAAEGGVIDDGDACMVSGGPTTTLRAEDGVGHDGDLIWTYSTASNTTYNYNEWWLKVSEPGRYKVEVYVDNSVASSRQSKYQIRSALGDTNVVVNQSTSGGFRNLGEYTLDPATPGRVRLNDNTGEAGSLRRKIVFDALRLTRIADATCARVRVETQGDPVNVRPSASTSGSVQGTIADGRTVERLSSAQGQSIQGVTTWHQVRDGALTGWVTGAYTVCVE